MHWTLVLSSPPVIGLLFHVISFNLLSPVACIRWSLSVLSSPSKQTEFVFPHKGLSDERGLSILWDFCLPVKHLEVSNSLYNIRCVDMNVWEGGVLSIKENWNIGDIQHGFSVSFSAAISDWNVLLMYSLLFELKSHLTNINITITGLWATL